MTNILDYLAWRGDLSFAQAPFNEVDGAILSRVSYFPFHRIGLDEASSGSLGEAAEAFLALPDIAEAVLFRDDYPLMKVLPECSRFRDLELLEYRNTFDTENETQFCVITVRLEEERYFISFRGTDNTLVGWKENFNMGFAAPVPSQRLARDYVNDLMEKRPGTLILGGHSKGGNLAAFAGAFCDEEKQARIDSVWNYDGPGFEKRLLEHPGYDRMRRRIHTLVPQSSVVGMLLEHEEKFDVVHSERSSIFQHDIYSWNVERDHFLHLETVTEGSRYLDAAVKEWIAHMDYGRREAFVDALYTILRNTNAQTLREMKAKPAAATMAMLRSFTEMDEETRKMMAGTLSALLRCAGDELTVWAREELAESLGAGES